MAWQVHTGREDLCQNLSPDLSGSRAGGCPVFRTAGKEPGLCLRNTQLSGAGDMRFEGVMGAAQGWAVTRCGSTHYPSGVTQTLPSAAASCLPFPVCFPLT